MVQQGKYVKCREKQQMRTGTRSDYVQHCIQDRIRTGRQVNHLALSREFTKNQVRQKDQPNG